MSNAGSSFHSATTARPCAAPTGAVRNVAAAQATRQVLAQLLARGRPASGRGSKTMIPPMCMCALSSACSSSRNVASRGVDRSPMMLGALPTRGRSRRWQLEWASAVSSRLVSTDAAGWSSPPWAQDGTLRAIISGVMRVTNP